MSLGRQRTLRYGILTPTKRQESLDGRDGVYIAQDIQDLWTCLKLLMEEVSELSSSSSSSSLFETTVESDVLSGTIDGANTVFTLPYAPIGTFFLFSNNIWQNPTDYTVLGNEITFTVAPALGSTPPYAIYRRASNVGFPAPIGEVPSGIIDGSNRDYVLSGACQDDDSLIFVTNGLTLYKDTDYTLTGPNIRTTYPLALGTTIYSYRDAIFPYVPGLKLVIEPLSGVVDGVNVDFTTSSPMIYPQGAFAGLNGVIAYGGFDFSVSGVTMTFVTPPTIGTKLYVFYIAYGVGGKSGITRTITNVTTPYSVLTTDDLLICDGTFNIALFTASGNIGKTLDIKNNGTGIVTVVPDGIETIDGESPVKLEELEELTIVSDGTNWIII